MSMKREIETASDGRSAQPINDDRIAKLHARQIDDVAGGIVLSSDADGYPQFPRWHGIGVLQPVCF